MNYYDKELQRLQQEMMEKRESMQNFQICSYRSLIWRKGRRNWKRSCAENKRM